MSGIWRGRGLCRKRAWWPCSVVLEAVMSWPGNSIHKISAELVKATSLRPQDQHIKGQILQRKDVSIRVPKKPVLS
jgi:hypothetical protein